RASPLPSPVATPSGEGAQPVHWQCSSERIPYRHRAFTCGRKPLGMSRASGGRSRASGGQPALGNGTPEQVHLTWGDDPATSVVVSWGSPARAARPRVRIGQRVIQASEQAYTDEATGKTVWTYHAPVPGLRAGAT